jgi:hypothetical protein
MQKYVGGICTDNEETFQERGKLSLRTSFLLSRKALFNISLYTTFCPKAINTGIGIPQGGAKAGLKKS